MAVEKPIRYFQRSCGYLLVAAFVTLCIEANFAQVAQAGGSNTALQGEKTRDGQHDFDFDLGTWKVHISRLQHPSTGSTTWTELDGTIVVSKVWGGRANFAESHADGPSGHLELLSLRLYNPQSHQWSLNFSSSDGGTLSVPMVGEFKNGRGEFFDQEPYKGRTILVRFVILPITPNLGRSEQAFSDDGGKTWEVNMINTYTRISDESDKTH